MTDALTRIKLLKYKQALTERARAAAVTGDTSLPVGDRDREWDGAAATRRIFDEATSEDGTVDTDIIRQAFLYRDDDADPTTQAAWKLGFADIVDGILTIIPRGVAATAGGRGVDAADIPEDEKDRVRTRICGLYERIQTEFEDWPDCPFERDMSPETAGDE